jgi:hypothetical protein
MLGDEPRPLSMLHKHSTTELQPRCPPPRHELILMLFLLI